MKLDVAPLNDDIPLVHVTWSHLGTDLAVVDAVGRISIFTVDGPHGHMVNAHNGLLDSESDLSAIVGFFWIPVFPFGHHVSWMAPQPCFG